MNKKIKVLMIDNYDSFTYNLVHYIEELKASVEHKNVFTELQNETTNSLM